MASPYNRKNSKTTMSSEELSMNSSSLEIGFEPLPPKMESRSERRSLHEHCAN